jgi:hypothetical protein
MTLPDWVTELAGRGITVLPPTTAVPVELYAALPDGRALHFRCRGTQATMRVFAAESVRVAVPVREATPTELPLLTEVWLPLAGAADVLRGGEHHLVRMVLAGQPSTTAVVDGRERFGWSQYEAGLLRVRDAQPLFEELLAALVPELALQTAA